MKKFIVRNMFNIFTVSIILTIILVPSFLQDNNDFFSTIFVVFSYALLFILLYGGTSSVIAEIFSLKAARKKRISIKILVYLTSLTIFFYFSPPALYLIYAFICAILYFLLDEYFRNKKTRAS